MKLVQILIVALILGPANALPQTLHFSRSLSLPLAEPLPNAFRIVTGDVNGDGRPDILVGTAAGVVLLASPANSTAAGRLIEVPAPCPIADLALADLDRDGVLDLQVYCASAGRVFLYRGLGDGTFQPPTNLVTSPSNSSRGIVAVDLNQDGIPDLAIAQDGKIVTLLGNGDATFRAGPALSIAGTPAPAQPVAIISADFNGDGKPDLATSNQVYYDEISVFLNLGAGQFSAETKIPTGDRPHDLYAVDINVDGTLDLAVACDAGLFLFLGDGHGAFTPGPRVLSNDRPLSVVATDLNGDGLPDVVLGNYYNGRISVLLNSPGVVLRPASTLASIGDTYGVALADVDGDGHPDLIASSYSGSSALLATGRADGAFEPPTYYGATTANSFILRLADLNNDRDPELAIVLPGRRTVDIFHRNSGELSTLTTHDYPLDAVFADFDGDGIPDVALLTVPDWRPDPGADFKAVIRVLRGRGDGTFGEEIATAVDRSPASQGYGSLSNRFLSLAAGDFDGDGIPDLALMNSPLQELQIYHGKGDGTFATTQRFPVSNASPPIVADFNGDGIPDLAFVSGQVTVYFGNANGNMVKSDQPAACQAPGALYQGDFNGDRRPDLLLNCGPELTVLLNAGNGAFQATPKTTVTGPYTNLSAIADFDHDGNDDVVIGTPSNGRLLLTALLSDGKGAFPTRIPFATPKNPVSILSMDLDFDGRPDLAFVDEDGILGGFWHRPE